MPQAFHRRPGTTPLTPEELQRWNETQAAFRAGFPTMRLYTTQYNTTTSWNGSSNLQLAETLEQVIQRLHRQQKFYVEHKKDLPSW